MCNTTFDAVEIYKEILSGKRKRFPAYFWKYFDVINYDNAREVTKYLIEEKLHWNNEQIKDNLSFKVFNDNGLSGMLKIVFNNSPFLAIDNAYPSKFKEWEFNYAPNNYWNLDTAKEATIWLIEERLHWNDEQIKSNLSIKVFKDNGLSGMLDVVFNVSPFLAIDNAYPGKFKEWEFNSVPNNYWNLDTAKEATIYLIEEKLHWNDEQIKNNLSKKVFKGNGLSGMLNIMFNDSPFLAIDNAYPGKFKEWELSFTPRNYWNLATAKKATIWLIEEKLKWNDEQIKVNLSAKIFKDNGLVRMLDIVFKGSPFLAIDNAYPGKFKKKYLSNYN